MVFMAEGRDGRGGRIERGKEMACEIQFFLQRVN